MKLLNLGCGWRFHSDWINVDFRSTGPGVIPCNLNHDLPFMDNCFDVVYHSHLLEHFPRRYAPVFLKECLRVLQSGGILRVVVPDFERIVRVYLDILEKAVQGDSEAQKRYDWIMIEMLDQMVRNKPGGEMLTYWKQNPMPAESFVIKRVGSEVLNVLKTLRKPANLGCSTEIESSCLAHEKLDPIEIGKFRLSGEIHQWMYDRYSLRACLEEAGFQGIRVCNADDSEIPKFNSYLLDIEADGSIRKPDSLFIEAKK